MRPVQWAYLPWRRLQRRLPPRVPAPPARFAEWRARRALEALGEGRTADALARADGVVSHEFSFVGRTETLPEVDWTARHVSHLWSYNLHYFDYARDLALAFRATGDHRFADAFVELALSWVRRTEPGRGDGWEPYPVSLRVVNWIHALALLGDAIPGDAKDELTGSLARQAGWLDRRLEHHVQGNHLLKNYHALALAGLCFDGAGAARWRRRGLAGIWRELRDQVLPDGVHFERSPMYHAIALHDALELIAFCGASGVAVPRDVRALVERMVSALGVLCRPDGTLHLLNDAAHGIAPTRDRLDDLADHVLGARVPDPQGIFALPDAGYYGCVLPGGVRLVVDCGVPGPRHQPGHAHCDLLSFELDVGGAPVVVDSGVHGYEGDPFREYARSTRAHNTVRVGGREQSEMWSTFRVARMAVPRGAEHALTDHEYRLRASFAPYFDRRVSITRELTVRRGRLFVADRCYGAESLAIQSYVHLHPRFEILAHDGASVLFGSHDGQRVRVSWTGVDTVRAGRGGGDPEGWYLPRFGRAVPGPVLVGERGSRRRDGAFGYQIGWD